MSAIWTTGEEPEKFVHDYYSKKAFLRAYDPIIIIVNGHHLWKHEKKLDMHPQALIVLLGRPKKVRKREPDEPPARKKELTRKCPDKPTLDQGQAAGEGEAFKNPTNHSRNIENQTNIGATRDTTTTGQAATDDATHATASEVQYLAIDGDDSWLEDLLFSDVINIGSQHEVGNTNTKIPTQPGNKPSRYKCSLYHEYGHNRSSFGVLAADLHAPYQA
ncbi:hypothetical protein ACH5RR_028701 [Cinchona calisaya]|uniref:Transposase n=1 Tax=Cinchona calisaya TaxID=153742 RepID=A0ABD2YPJ3_9GENT